MMLTGVRAIMQISGITEEEERDLVEALSKASGFRPATSMSSGVSGRTRRASL
jgi:hypothetical protein